ncbi:ComEC/Rec2 family competence protein [Oceanicoccus sp. KOV_DT_Chl]|uniref:ComEC/Rec2 family competence protein n=1 Tax=Oceanicoccus sp. KOV_DT_Chl TaxID=1904639 RepID=UPI000C7AB623|nr:ComEC/Rec2 family competence protein [Oceanicoccus sp. KOV_DT_Chl]
MLSWMMAVSVGIAAVSLLPELPPQWYLLLALLVSVLLTCWLKHWRWLLLVLLGINWGGYYGHQLLAQQLPIELEQQPIWLQGRISGLPTSGMSRGQSFQQFDLNVTDHRCISPAGDCAHRLKRVRLKWYGAPQPLKPGQHWRLLVTLKRPYGTSNPGGFDYQSWLIQQGIGATGYVRPSHQIRLLADDQWGVDRWRWRVANYMDSLPNLPHSHLLKALLIGDKRDIGSGQWQLFAATGTTHLMVISGLHVGMVTGLVFLISRCLLVISLPNCRAHVGAAWLAISVALLYALAAGFTLPTQRALLMIAVVLLCVIRQRHISPLAGLALALLLCLLLDPLAVITVSFWLSFVAVGAILYASTGRRQSKTQSRQWMLAQYAVFIGLIPVLAMCFGQITLLSPVANSLLLPVFSILIVPLDLVAAVLAFFSESAAQWLWQQLDRVLAISLQGLSYLHEVAGVGVLTISAKPLMVKCMALVGAMVLLLPKGLPLKWLGLLLLIPLFAYQSPLMARVI